MANHLCGTRFIGHRQRLRMARGGRAFGHTNLANPQGFAQPVPRPRADLRAVLTNSVAPQIAGLWVIPACAQSVAGRIFERSETSPVQYAKVELKAPMLVARNHASQPFGCS